MRTRFALPAVGLCALALCAEERRPQPGTLPPPEETGTRNRTVTGQSSDAVLPVPLVHRHVIPPGAYEPLTPREKAARALRNSIGAGAMVNRLVLAGINQGMDHPEEWPGGMEGYGMRFGSRVGRLWVRNAIELGSDLVFQTESRYDRCNCAGFLARSGHAWKRVLVALKDDGAETVAISRLAGAYVTPMLTDQWNPSRLNTWEHKLNSGSQFLLWRGATNMLREFWPEISRKMPAGKNLYR